MIARHDAKVLALEIRSTLKLAESLGSPRALTVFLLLRHGEYEQLVNLDCDARNYRETDREKFADDYLITSILKKNPRLPLNIDRRAVAISKFIAAEESCKQTNNRLNDFLDNPHSADPLMVNLVLRTRDYVERIIGRRPSGSDLSYAYDSMRFGPGATTTVSGVVSRGRKYSKRPISMTPGLVSFRASCFPHLWKQQVHHCEVTDSSKLTTVPKNAKTDRCICIEPDLNIFVQLGVGALLKKKLKNFGVDLSSQETNQQMARRAYKTGLATVDLSAASDTISIKTVTMLLPSDWVELLAMARTPCTTLPSGDVVPLQKWSSMGNGYTFELETLIFYGASLAVTDLCEEYLGDVRSYGDDIIVPRKCVPLLSRFLNFLGFSLNAEKTFGEGLFYESCGADYFCGYNVRPFYFRSDSHDFESICYLYANQTRRYARHRNGVYGCDSRFLPVWLSCFTAVNAKNAYRIPEGYGDVGFVVDFDAASPTLRFPREAGWSGYYFHYRGVAAKEKTIDAEGSYIGSLCQGLTAFSHGRETLRGIYAPAQTKRGYTLVWPNLGPWI